MIGFGNLCWWLSQYDGDDDDDDDADDDGDDDDEMMMSVSGNEWNSENCFSESENATREGIGGSSLRSNLSKSPVEEYWEWVFLFAILIVYDLFIPALKFLVSQTVSVTWVAFRLVLSSPPTSGSGDKIFLLRQEL